MSVSSFMYDYLCSCEVRWQKLRGSSRSGSTTLSYRNCVITLVGGWWGQSIARAITRCMMKICSCEGYCIKVYMYDYIHVYVWVFNHVCLWYCVYACDWFWVCICRCLYASLHLCVRVWHCRSGEIKLGLTDIRGREINTISTWTLGNISMWCYDDLLPFRAST